MLVLKCTAEVQRAIGLTKQQIVEAHAVPAPLGGWYVHRFTIGRTQCYLFMSEVSLLSFLLYQGKKKVNDQTLPLMFMTGLGQLLAMKGFEPDLIHLALQDYSSCQFTKTDSRKLLGSMNDLVYCYRAMIEAQGGLNSCDLTRTIMKINDMPQRTLNWGTSWGVTASVLAADRGVLH